MDVRPIVVQRNSAGIRMSGRFQSKPVLDLALLPVHGRQFRRQGRKARLAPWDGRLQDEITRIAAPFENIVVIKDALRGDAILGEHRYQSGVMFGKQKTGCASEIGPVQCHHELVLGSRAYIAAELLSERFPDWQHYRTSPVTTLEAL